MRTKDCWLCVASLMAASQAWADASSTTLNIRLTLLDRCQVTSTQAAWPSVDARCSNGVARAVSVAPMVPPAQASLAPSATQAERARTSQPLPADALGASETSGGPTAANTSAPNLVAIVF